MACVGLAFFVLGVLMTLREGVAPWDVTDGRGAIWARLLGEARAVKLTRYFFGPLTAVLGVFALLASLMCP